MGNYVSQPIKRASRTTPPIDQPAVKLPPFISTDPELWFDIVERTFEATAITDEFPKCNYICDALQTQVVGELKDLIINWPANRPYTELKTELLKRSSVAQELSKTRRLLELEEMGERKTSQILQHLQGLEGNEMSKECLDKIADLADSIVEHLRLTPTRVAEIQARPQQARVQSISDDANAKSGDMTADTEKDLKERKTDSTRCLLCDCKGIFGDRAVMNSYTVCKKCYKLISETDELQSKLAEIKVEMYNLHKKSAKFSKESLNEVRNENGDVYSDHNYNVNVESVQAEPTEKSEKITIIANKAIVKPEIFESAKKIDDQYEQSNYTSTGNASQEEELLVVPENDAEAMLLERKENVKKFATRYGNSYICTLCTGNEESRDSKSIIAHLKEKHDFHIYICDTCGDFMKKQSALPHDLYNYATKDEIEFMCEECIEHYNNYFKRSSNPQICETCHKNFNSKNSLERHKKGNTKNRSKIR